MKMDLRSVGFVRSELVDLSAAPRQPDEGAPDAWLVFDHDVQEALNGLQINDEILLLTWLDRAQRNTLSVHPRGDASRPRAGVFSTRSASRPNPLGIHRTTITAIDGGRIRVAALEAIDGTPIVDIKPVLASDVAER